MKCPECGTELMPDVKMLPYTYKGHTTMLETRGDFCQKCGEAVLDTAEWDRQDALMQDFQRQVNSTVVSPEFITAVRKKLHLDQKRAAELFGGGVNAFSRYERGKAVPPQSLVVLFQLLDKKPELMDTVMEFAQPRTSAVDKARQSV